jgi:membrane fusion protein (multidrug efflux system)
MAAAVILLLIVLVGVKAYFVSATIAHFKAMGTPTFTVSAATAQMSDWQPSQTAVASLHAVHGADLSSELPGIVDSIEFESGQDVKAGQLLVRLRAADDIAHLESLKATAALNQILYARDQVQLEAQAISQTTLDTDAANLKSAQAQMHEQQAIVDKKLVRAPFAGRVGIRAVDPGQYVAAGTKLVTLQALDPIYVDFFLPQQSLTQIAVGQRVTVTTDSSATHPFIGLIEAVNPQVDTNTRNVQVRASLRNPEHKLLPGMYVNVSVEAGAARRYLTLPQTAVTYNPYGASVYVIKPASAVAATSGAGAGAAVTATPAPAAKKDHSPAPNSNSADLAVQQQFVETGPTRGDQVAIVKGLQEGDLVVTSGQLKLKSGALVVVDNTVTPANDPAPNPVNE